MKKRVGVLLLAVLLSISTVALHAEGFSMVSRYKTVRETYAPPADSPQYRTTAFLSEVPADPIAISLLDGSAALYFSGQVTFSVQITNSGSPVLADLVWYRDGAAVESVASKRLDAVTEITFDTKIPFDRGAGFINFTLEAVTGGKSRKLVIDLPVYPYTDEEWHVLVLEEARRNVLPGGVPCTVRKTQTLYGTAYYSNPTDIVLPAGSKVAFLNHHQKSAAYVRTEDGRFGWMPYDNLNIPYANYTDSDDWSDEGKVLFVNAMGYSSRTKNLVFISLKKQSVTLLEGSQGNWSVVKSFKCATGANRTPTPQGEFEYQALNRSGWKEKGHWVYPVLYMDMGRGIAMHSILFHYDGSVMDSTIGRPASEGCVRMRLDDVNWLADNLPLHTKIVVY